jgi:hypothetical protein
VPSEVSSPSSERQIQHLGLRIWSAGGAKSITDSVCAAESCEEEGQADEVLGDVVGEEG